MKRRNSDDMMEEMEELPIEEETDIEDITQEDVEKLAKETREQAPKKRTGPKDKIPTKLIEEVVGELLGEEVIPLVFKLREGENVSEFVIAKDMGLDIHQARSILYKLYEYGLATFYRKKDKIKGWYVCYWDFDPTQIEHIHSKIKKEKLEKLQERLSKEETNDFYMCKNLCLRTTFDQAAEMEFKCPECSEIMYPVDNKRTIEFLQERIGDLRKEISA